GRDEIRYLQEKSMAHPQDYVERVYAGVLGKMIGVYLGRPFEGWTYERIMAELGEISYYVNERLASNPPLVITDDDLTGTFTFLRALSDRDNPHGLTPAQIGQTWLNYIIEGRTILWWGGLGNSTEHTAYLRLKKGIQAPQSGSAALNGKIVSEQIGAQIFIDGWAMVAPGDPEMAADLARRAASVSHDGEAIYGSQVLAAMQAQAFVENDIDKLIDCGVSFIPKESIIYRMIADLRTWHAGETDWHKTRARIAQLYGYDRYPGVCHMVPNHALIILGLLYGEGDFQKSMRVVNTAGWDTDCNAGNLGCLLGIKNGLAGLETGPDWRGPLADRLYLPTADGGGAISDAVAVTYQVVNSGRALAGEGPLEPKGGARFHFELPGSVQGFRSLSEADVTLKNVLGHSRTGERALALRYRAGGGCVAVPAFILPHELDMPGYELIASPTLYPGQSVRVGLSTEQAACARLFLHIYDSQDELFTVFGPEMDLTPAGYSEAEWRIPDLAGQPVAEVGLELKAISNDGEGVIYLDYLTWEGEADVVLGRPPGEKQPWEPPQVWRRAWVNGMDQWEVRFPQAYRLAQNNGRGLIIQGTREWRDYVVSAVVTPTLMAAGGVGARVQGMRRYYALLLCDDGKARLVKALDGSTVLAEAHFAWEAEESYDLRLMVDGMHLRGWVDDRLLFDVIDTECSLDGGGVALVLEEGHMICDAVVVRPVNQ
ncbi:MAG: ADP-ribosylglycohydrolase family protein, partial [Anaerolineaceae bacterium]|nr:ADP-ribosylglycohydrolase family protein [Anaerolineaceae bacterium]